MFDHSFVTRIRRLHPHMDHYRVEAYTGTNPDNPSDWQPLHDGTQDACQRYTEAMHKKITPEMAEGLNPRNLKRQ